jgi:hypothetical protein
MAYVKLKKAAGDFDILSSENVASVKLATSTEDGLLVVNFIGDLTNNITIKPVGWIVGTVSTHFVQADATALNEAIGLIGGGSGMINVSLSKVVDEVTYASA